MDDAPIGIMPLFGSEARMRILAKLFDAATRPELSIGELAREAWTSQSTASQEVARLTQFGVVATRNVGRTRLVSGNWALPWAEDLAGLLAKTVGLPARLADVLAGVAGVEEAFIFGSWAARFVGEPGPPPDDVDVVVVGTAELGAVRDACRAVELMAGLEVQAFVVDRATWKAKKGTLAEIHRRPTVQIPLAVTA